MIGVLREYDGMRSFLAPTRAWWLGIAAITVLGATVRLAGLDTHSFWYDEAVTASLAERSAAEIALGEARDNGNPPLFPLVEKISRTCLGEREWAYRLAPACFAIFSIPLIGVLGAMLAGPAEGIAAAILLAVSPFSIELSTEARAYSLLHLLAILATIALILWIRERRPRWAALYLISVILACLTHYYAVFLVMAHGLTLAARADLRRLLPAWLAIIACVLLACSFWIPAFHAQLTTPGNLSRFDRSWVTQFLATPMCFSLGRTLVWRSDPPALLALGSLAVLGTFVACFALGMVRLRRSPAAFVLVTAWVALPIVLPGIAAVLGKPLYHTRAASVAMPAFLLAAAVGIVAMRPRPRVILATAMLALAAISVGRFFGSPLRDDWRAATPYLAKNAHENDVLVFDSDIQWRSFCYYARQQQFMPKRMYGVVGGLSEEGHLSCLELNDGIPEGKVGDYTRAILAAKGIWLVSCVPVSKPDEYRQFFSGHGFHEDGAMRFHRIDLMHLSSSGGPAER